MATQTGSIDLRGANSAKLYVDDEAGEIRSEVSETYATKTEVRRTDSGTGTVVTSDDATNLPPLSLTVHGKSVQDGTPTPSAPVEIRSVKSRNLLDQSTYATGVYSINTDGSIHVAGTDGRAWAAWTSNTVELDGTAHVYYWVSDVPVYVQIGTTYAMSSINGATSGFVIASSSTGLMVKILAPSGKSYPFDAKLSLSEYPVRYPLAFGSEIQQIVTGANVLPNGSDFAFINNAHKVTVTRTDGVYTFDGTSQSTGGRLDTIYRIASFRLPAGTYRAAALYSGTGKVAMYVHRASKTDSSATILCTVEMNADGLHVLPSFTVDEGDIIFIGFNISSSSTAYDCTVKPIIVRGSDAPTEYVPFQGSVTPIDLDGNSVCTTPSVGDVLEVDGEGNATLTKSTMTKVFDGSETWTQNSVTANNLRMVTTVADLVSVTNTDTEKRAISSMLRSETASVAVGSDNANVIAGISNHRLFVSVPIATYPNVAAWTAKLASTPMTVIYELAEPQTISLGKIDLPSLPSPSFSMHVDAEVTPTIDAEWWTQGGEEVGSVYQLTSALEQDAEGLSVRMRGLETDAVRKSKDEWTAWLDVGTDSDNNPFLAMGQSGNDLNSRLSNESMGFYNGTEELMKLSGADGVKADTVRTKRVYIGPWILEELDSGDMAIKLVGGGA